MNDASFFESRDANVPAQADETSTNPVPASESLPDGQFQDDDMPTTDGEPADREDPSIEGDAAEGHGSDEER
jgi:hypothetical protein